MRADVYLDGRGKTPGHLVGLLPVLAIALLQFDAPTWTAAPNPAERQNEIWRPAAVAPQHLAEVKPAVYRGPSSRWHVQEVADGQWAALRPQARPYEEAVRTLIPENGRRGALRRNRSYRLRVQYVPPRDGYSAAQQSTGNPWSAENRSVVPPVYGTKRQGSGNVWRSGEAEQTISPGTRQNQRVQENYNAPGGQIYRAPQRLDNRAHERYSRRVPDQTGSMGGQYPALERGQTPQLRQREQGYREAPAYGGRQNTGGSAAPVFGDYPPLDDSRDTAGRDAGNGRQQGDRYGGGQVGRQGWQSPWPYEPGWGYQPYFNPLVPIPPAPSPW